MLRCQDGPCFYLCWYATSTLQNMTSFAKIGSVGEHYISHGISPLSHSITSHYYCYYYYIECVNAAVEKSMMAAVEEIKGLSHYADKGEVKNM